MNDYPWTIFFILLAAGLLATAAVLPYSLALNPSALEKIKASQAGKARPMPAMLVVILSGMVNGTLLSALAVFVGLLATRAVGLHLPILEAALAGKPFANSLLAILPVGVLAGLGSGAAIGVLEHWVFGPRLPASLKEAVVRTSFWKSVLACFYGGIEEEILMRLFILSGLAWLLGLVWHSANGLPAAGAFWLANLLATLLFGLGHLPATAQLTRLTPLIVTRALVLNGIPGLICGYLYIAYGLEAAMLAHFCADIVIHLIYPAIEPAVQAAKLQTSHS